MHRAVKSEVEGDLALTALGSDVRRAILKLLADGPLPAGGIAEKFAISRPAISKHLKLLLDAHLIAFHTEGTRNLYRIEQRGFIDGRAWLDQFWPDVLRRFQMITENTCEPDQDA